MAVSDEGRVFAAGARSTTESMDSIPHAVALKATPRVRHTNLTSRADDGAAAKSRPVLFAATLAGALLLAAAVAWLSHPAAPVRPKLHRHCHSLSPSGPPTVCSL